MPAKMFRLQGKGWKKGKFGSAILSGGSLLKAIRGGDDYFYFNSMGQAAMPLVLTGAWFEVINYIAGQGYGKGIKSKHIHIDEDSITEEKTRHRVFRDIYATAGPFSPGSISKVGLFPLHDVAENVATTAAGFGAAGGTELGGTGETLAEAANEIGGAISDTFSQVKGFFGKETINKPKPNTNHYAYIKFTCWEEPGSIHLGKHKIKFKDCADDLMNLMKPHFT